MAISKLTFATLVSVALRLVAASSDSDQASSITRTLTVPTTAPSNAVQVPADFVGFGFGQAWLPNYANSFSEALISSVGKRMSEAPVIRLGGTVGDKFLWDPNQKEAIVAADGGNPTSSQSTFILGPKYFDYLKYFPDARMTFQATLGKKLNLSSTVPIIKRAYDAIGAKRLVAIAVGNEVSVEYNTADSYVKAALQIEDAVIKALSLTGDARNIFEVVDTLSPAAASHKPYAAQEAFQAGINKNGFAKVAAEHWYQYSGKGSDPFSDAELQSGLMNHSAITDRFSGYEKSIDYIKRQYPGVQYVLSETGAAIGTPNPPTNFCDGFGSALWSVDFNLAAMVRRVDRLADSGRPAAAHSSWVPDDSSKNQGPTVRAPFAVDPMMADFVGKTSHKVVEVAISGTPDLMSAYAGYATQSGNLDRIALVNMHSWSASDKSSRPVRQIRIPLPSSVKSVKVQRLHADHGAGALGFDLGGAGANVTWAGEQWTYKVDKGAGHFPSGKTEEDTVSVVNGVAQVPMPDSEAAIVWI